MKHGPYFGKFSLMLIFSLVLTLLPAGRPAGSAPNPAGSAFDSPLPAPATPPPPSIPQAAPPATMPIVVPAPQPGVSLALRASADWVTAGQSEFLQRAQGEGLPTKVSADGTIRVFDPETGTFGSYNPDGTTKTFFKPTSPTYWDRQPGTSPYFPEEDCP